MENEIIEKKTGISFIEAIDAVENAIINGEVDNERILKEFTIAKMIRERLDKFDKVVKASVLNAYLVLHDDKATTINGVTYKVSTTPRKYDYSISEDWKQAKAAEDECAKKRKAIEKKLQVCDCDEYVDKASGEIISAIEKSGGERYVVITLAKEG